jgi:DNA primase
VLPRMKDGRQAFFLFLPDGEDPDTIIRSEGQSGFEQRLKDATSLSEFFFADIGKDVNLATLDGKARLAERAKPLLAGIPDGAFRDLMHARMNEITGLRSKAQIAAEAPQLEKPVQRSRNNATPKRSLVRSAIALLLQDPSLVSAVEPPYRFAELRQPGIPLLLELIEICRARPDIATGVLVEHFAERPEGSALRKLATGDLPGSAEGWRDEFIDALAQLERQTVEQRKDDLLAKQRETELSKAETAELWQAMTLLKQ